MLQCDFCYMISPEMFDEFVKPELAATCKRIGNAFYHLDGIGQLPHLDSMLEIDELRGIQWVPGTGQKRQTEWPEVYRKIRDAGKRIQIYEWGGDVLDTIADQLGSPKGIVNIAHSTVDEREETMAFLRRYDAC
jgi:5-methyltetrahydrofolate--homocysteine methyltransferase